MPRTVCKYCKSPVFKQDRCEHHYEGYVRRRAGSAESAAHACKKCGKPASLREREEGRCRVCDPPPYKVLAPFDFLSEREEAARELREIAEDLRAALSAKDLDEIADRIDAAVAKWEAT